ncbi:hypothetical protein PV328_002842, partial [Microctonus aethiopoides]
MGYEPKQASKPIVARTAPKATGCCVWWLRALESPPSFVVLRSAAERSVRVGPPTETHRGVCPCPLLR